MRYSMAAASMAHTYGNVTSFMNNWLLSLFPENYFKTNYISSTIAYKDMASYKSSTTAFVKKRKPMLVIRPRIELDTMDELPINQTYLANRIYDMASDDIDTGNLQNFFLDKKNHRQIQFLLNALRINFDVTIVVETYMQQINLAHYFKNRVRQEWDLRLNANLESFISRDIMYLLAKDSGFEDVFENGERMGEFLSYVNSHSIYPVTVKYKNSSGRHEFFRFHPAWLNVAISGLSMDDGTKKGQIQDSFMINFTVRCDFMTAGMYNYVSDNDAVFNEFKPNQELADGAEIIPLLTPQEIFTEPLPEGWNIFTMPLFEIDTDKVPYPLDFSVLLNTSLNEAVRYHKENGIPMDVFLHVDVTKNGRIMEVERGEYEIDWENLTLYVYNCNHIQDYRFILSVNTQYLNDLIGDIIKYKEEK